MPAAPSLPPQLRQAMAAHRSGRVADAARRYRRFLALHPRNPRVWELLALSLMDLGRSGEAVDAIRRSIEQEPAEPAWRTLLVRALRAADRVDEAVDEARAALDLVPATVELLVAAAQVAVVAGRDDEAVAWSRQALAIDPDGVEALILQAIALRRQERHLEALRLLERAIELDDAEAVAHYEAGVVRYELGEVTEPLRLIRRAIALDPSNHAFHSGEGMVLNRLGRFDEAVAAYDRALVLRPGDPVLEANQSWPLIGRGDFARGWAQHERAFDLGGRRPNRSFDVPRWDGGADAGRLLVWREQGVGDELRCASMVPDVIQRVGDVVVECDARLVSLLARSFPDAEVRAQQLDGVTDFDMHCPIHSLPAHVRPDVASYRRPGAYLRPDPQLVATYRNLVAARSEPGVLNVGMSWRSMMLATSRLSYYTVLEEWAPVLGAQGVRFWNLQYGRPELLEQERHMVRDRFGVDIEVVDGLDYTDDFESLAALITGLDVVVSVGTAVACLAGALGRRVLLLDVDFDPFRFSQPDYPWFDAFEVIARHPEAPWDGVMRQAAARLAELS